MIKEIKMDAIYAPSDDIVARDIEGELIIVPLMSGIGDMESELYTLNETGKVIWSKLDGKNRLDDVINLLKAEFEAPKGELENDVVGLIEELLKRRIVIEVTTN